MNDSHPPNSKRRWDQFSVRTVLIAVLVPGLFLSWLHARAARNRQALAELHRVAFEISSQGGDIDYEYAERRPNQLEKLLGDPGVFDVKGVSMGRSADAGLEHLKGLTRPQDLNLIRTQITREGLRNLQ